MNISLEPNGKLVSIELTNKDMQQIYNEDNWYIYFNRIDKFMEEVKSRYASNVCSETDRQRS
jgi:hypothetical protein